MEKTGFKTICGAPTTLAVKGLMMMMNYCPCFVGAGIIVVDEDILETDGWTLIFHLLDNFG